MNEFIGKWRNFITEERSNHREKYEIGDEVILRGGNTVTDTFTVVAKRRMFGSDLMAYSVEHPNGETMEYDETQLSAVPTIMGDRAARSAQFNDGNEFEDEHLDADDVLDGILDENLAEMKSLNENAPGYNTRKFGHSLPTLESVQSAYEAKEEPKAHVKEDSFSGAEIDPNVELYSNDAVDWDFEESIKKIIDELKEYQKANPQDDLQKAINHLEYLIFIKEDIEVNTLKEYIAEGFLGHPSERESKRDFKKQFPKSKGSAGEPGVTAASRSQDFGHSDSIISLVDNLTLTMGEDAFIAAVFKALPLEDAKRILRGITNDNPVHGMGGSPADIDDWLNENDQSSNPQRLGPSSQFTFEPSDPKKDLMIHKIVDEYQEKIFDYLWNYELYKNEYSKDFGY